MGLDQDRPARRDASRRRPPGWQFPAAISAICLLAAVVGDTATDTLRFDRDAIAAGETWRLATAHFVHLGWSHLALNVVGLALVWILVGTGFRLSQWCVALLVSIAGVDVGLWFVERQLSWYVGLSGVLHGLLIAGVIPGIARRAAEPMLIAVIVALKLGYEQLLGPLPGSESSAGGPVLVNAHLYGALAGAAFGILMWRSVGRSAPI